VRATISVARGGFALDLSLEVEPGQTLALLGPNGAGKSTALAAIAGLVENAGTIELAGRLLDEVPVECRRIGYVFQDSLLFPHLTVLDNVAFGSTRAVADEWMRRLDLADLAAKRPPQLSGGQAQRVALARALATAPDLLLLDEPLAALDVAIRDEVRAELAAHLASVEVPTIVVTHSFEDVAALADHVIVIEGGVATQRATVRELVRSPATPYVARLVRDWADD
jgi:molybdate transport system ATP-binding protein